MISTRIMIRILNPFNMINDKKSLLFQKQQNNKNSTA